MLRLTRAPHTTGDLQLLAFQYLGVGESYGGPRGPAARVLDDAKELLTFFDYADILVMPMLA